MTATKDYICKNCGSNDILHDAWARWNNLLRCFELTNVFDDKKCGQCDTTYRHLDMVEIPPK